MWGIVFKSSMKNIGLIKSPIRVFSSTSTRISEEYLRCLKNGSILKDPNQSGVVYYFSRLENALKNYKRPEIPAFEIVRLLETGGVERVGIYDKEEEAKKDMIYYDAISKDNEKYKLKPYLQPTVLSNAFGIRKKITESYQVVPRLPTEVVPYSVAHPEFRKQQEMKKIEKRIHMSEEDINKLERGHTYEWCRVPRGIYLYGNVGTGKSMIMDMFYNCVSVNGNKYRVHFHEFMQDIHRRVHERNIHMKGKEGVYEHSHLTGDQESIIQVSKDIALEYPLICFDEFHVTDIADALILCHIFETLFKCGTVVVCTSNQSPELLYKGGLNRYYFLPFISLLQQYCRPIDIDSSIDYRKTTAFPVEDVVLYPLGEATTSVLESLYPPLFKPNTSLSLPIKGNRVLEVPSAYKGLCMFTFKDLCINDRGIDDYMSICKHFHTLILTDVPIFTLDKPSSLSRFVTLIDQLYDNKKRIILTAETPIDGLFKSVFDLEQHFIDKAKQSKNEMEKGRYDSVTAVAFSCRRTLSRLYEMTSKDYLNKHSQMNENLE
ncbi:hypothetical protein WA158_001611 [Blastocystis sp. Blastoise]